MEKTQYISPETRMIVILSRRSTLTVVSAERYNTNLGTWDDTEEEEV